MRIFVLLVAVAAFVTETSALIPYTARKAVKRTVGAVGGAAAVGLFAFWMQQRNENNENLFQPATNSLEGQTILITGGTTGLGLETAKRLTVGCPSEIILTARSHAKGQSAIAEINKHMTENNILDDRCHVSYKLLDLDSLQAIRDAVESWNNDFGEIDVLLNNAGVMAVSNQQVTVDGVEKQMQSNHLGHFLLTALLASKLKHDARVINVSSAAYKIPGRSGLDFEYMWKGEPNYGAWKSYGQSKLANIYFTQELQRRARENGLDWQVASLHPGAVATDLGRHIMGVDNWERIQQGDEDVSFFTKAALQGLALFIKSVPEGANTHVYLASKAPTAEPLQAQYFVNCKPEKLSAVAMDSVAAKRLWEESEGLCQIEFFDMERIRNERAVVPEVLT